VSPIGKAYRLCCLGYGQLARFEELARSFQATLMQIAKNCCPKYLTKSSFELAIINASQSSYAYTQLIMSNFQE
jgi:hypothetical protein